MSVHQDLLDTSCEMAEREMPREERRAQRISWARGELMMRYPEMTYEKATEIVTAAAASMPDA